MVLADGDGQLQRGVVEIGDGAVAGQLQGGLGLAGTNAASFCNSVLGPNPFHRHRQHRRQGEQEMDLVLGKHPPPRRVRPQHAEGLPMPGNRDG